MVTNNAWDSQNPAQVAKGGTGLATITSHGILLGNATGNITPTAEPTHGQILIGNTGNFPSLGTLTAGAGISITNAAGSITIASTAGSIVWALTTVDASIVAGNGYIANKAGLLSMTLPAVGAINDSFKICNINTAVGWRIVQNANQYIRFGNLLTTTGAGGYLEATALGDTVECTCIVAGASTGWLVTYSTGNITVV